MRIAFLLVVVTAGCGRVGFQDQDARPPDAPMPVPVPVDAAPADAAPPDSAALCRTDKPSRPMWTDEGPFVDVGSTVGVIAYLATGHVPAPASFDVPVNAGWRILGFSFKAYGDGSNLGLTGIQVMYQPDATMPVLVLASGQDLGRKADWGDVVLPDFKPVDLTGGHLWVQFTVTEQNYYFGAVTPVFEHPCM